MLARLGILIYWLATGLAVLAFLVAAMHTASILGLTPGRMDDAGFAAIASAVIGVVIWACGRAFLYLFAGR